MVTFSDEELIDVFSHQLPDLLERRPELEPIIFQGFLKAFVRREELAVILDELREFRAEVNQRFEQVDQRFEQVDQRFEQVDQRFEQVDQRFEQVDQRLDRAEGATNALRAEMNQRFEQVDHRLDRAEEAITALRTEMNQRFEEVEASMDAREFELHQAIDRLGSRWGIRNEIVFRKTIAALLEESFGVEVEQLVIDGEQFDIVIHDHQHILVEIAASVGRTIGNRLERKRRMYTEFSGIEPTRVILATADIHSHRAQALRDKGIEVIEPEEPDYSKI